MGMHLFYLIAGTVAMVVGADYSVRTSLKLAQRWGWPDWVAGMLLLALGTSLPELFVSLSSVAEHPHLSLGNLMGSNLFNVAVVLGACLLIKGKHRFQVESIEWPSLMPLIIGSVFVFTWFYYPPSQSSSSLFLIVLYTWVIGRSIKTKAEINDVMQNAPVTSTTRVGLMCISGFIMLSMGAQYFLKGALGISNTFGWNDGFAGFMLAAIGTSLPELLTSIFALKLGRAQAVFGNVIGSNAFNLLITGGIVGLFTHEKFDDDISLFMLFANLGATLLLVGPKLMNNLRVPNPRQLHALIGLILLVGYVLVIKHAYTL
jgi:cation:H+ antiporter